ncbi:GDSL esterase/lipase At5g03980 [Oryza sativa Japonica Group]|jgi:phospholipase/lecithinase/hemolysin|uniref:GDSL-like Lipase/Acylhydrolase family protein, expressed n=2 Tax=Oryza sativa subsp. japonica TaxID=39947 RepID=Q2R3H2_ORYSJ|nr:acetylajmalan esterase [Oryza sativa Japonica Group]ABA93963.1 GDSL-like Lipase/Acylhydrolase family protein, expressed [Oryza sativa Japonica Group]KAF2911044.1 hypothetical protein DAI22_11g148000 [Oryza sativa Japonica Group]BAH95292.1 Os11g0521000 [Oryza sativa Japonica Group]BAT14217.1 Os11g0521000 [Oryza sativa Japonica Group]|eukprot:NP_001176564.1 Os11g0521000 [Oryza sativa Japonica Group]
MAAAAATALAAVILLLVLATTAEAACSVSAIYSFGDSIADTGNLLREGPAVGAFASIGTYPYGQTLRRPTGRCSDGLLIIDYFAMALNLSLVSPYLEKGARFESGVNFAVAGATALDRSYLLQSGVVMPPASVPLSSQLDWFRSHLNSTCSSHQDCAKKLSGALFLVGEIGGNDYNYAFFQGRSIESMKTYVPQVVRSIMDVAKEVIELGATKIVIPGNFPIGCSPSYLSLFSTAISGDYDDRGCLKSYNSFAMYHNDQLRAAIDDLRKVNSDVAIVYADYYGAFMHLLQKADLLGFEEDSLFKACCGAGGKYNFDMNLMCGAVGTNVCADPAQHISWDGIHLTQQAYKAMALSLIMEGFAQPADIVQKIWSC